MVAFRTRIASVALPVLVGSLAGSCGTNGALRDMDCAPPHQAYYTALTAAESGSDEEVLAAVRCLDGEETSPNTGSGIMEAVAGLPNETAVQALLDSGVDVNLTGRGGTALHGLAFAPANSQSEVLRIVDLLKSRGVDPCIEGGRNETPYSLAMGLRNFTYAEALRARDLDCPEKPFSG